jgi:hypothetical protein
MGFENLGLAGGVNLRRLQRLSRKAQGQEAGSGRGLFDVLYRHLSRGYEENNEKLSLRQGRDCTQRQFQAESSRQTCAVKIPLSEFSALYPVSC